MQSRRVSRYSVTRCFAAAALAAVFGASATTAAAVQAPQPVAAAATARGTVTIQRGFNLGCYNAMPLTVFVDGRPVSAIAVGQTLTLRVLPGQRRIGLAIGDDGSMGAAPRGVALAVAAGGSTALFANLGPGGSSLRTLAR